MTNPYIPKDVLAKNAKWLEVIHKTQPICFWNIILKELSYGSNFSILNELIDGCGNIVALLQSNDEADISLIESMLSHHSLQNELEHRRKCIIDYVKVAHLYISLMRCANYKPKWKWGGNILRR